MANKILIVIFALLCGSSISAQTSEVPMKKEIYGFGSPVIKFTNINNDFAILIGGRGGWIFGDRFMIGGGGYGLVSENYTNIEKADSRTSINFGYVGFELEYILIQNDVFSFSINTLLGGGALSYTDYENVFQFETQRKSDAFIIIEPAAQIYFITSDWLSIGTGISYKILSKENIGNPYKNDVKGISGILTFKFGY